MSKERLKMAGYIMKVEQHRNTANKKKCVKNDCLICYKLLYKQVLVLKYINNGFYRFYTIFL